MLREHNTDSKDLPELPRVAIILTGKNSYKKSGAEKIFTRLIKSRNCYLYFKNSYYPDLIELKKIIEAKDKTYSPLAFYFLLDNDDAGRRSVSSINKKYLKYGTKLKYLKPKNEKYKDIDEFFKENSALEFKKHYKIMTLF